METYGKRIKISNPFKKRTGWITIGMANSFSKKLMKLEGY